MIFCMAENSWKNVNFATKENTIYGYTSYGIYF